MSASSGRLGKFPAFLSLTASVSILVLLHVYRPSVAGLWLETFYNSMHVPAFALIALGLFVAFRFFSKLRVGRRVAIAMALSLLLGVLSEAAQIPGPRDASIEDLIADWLGSISALLLLLAVAKGDLANRRIRATCAITGIILMFLALTPLILVSAAYVERNRSLPMIFSFDVRFSKTFLRLQNSTIVVTSDPTVEREIGKVTLESGSWPGLIFHDLWPDWRDYSYLIVELATDDENSLEIHIRVHDENHSRGNQPYDDRFNMTYNLKYGTRVIRIPLDEIRDAPRDRQMDLSRIHGIVIFATRAETGRKFDLIELRLE